MSIRTTRTSKRIAGAIAAIGIAATTFAITSPASAAQTVTESRVAGADRYATAAAVATATFTSGSNNIILASGQDFPDGLSASGLAGFANAPVLLTTVNTLPVSTAGAIATLDGLAAGAATVHIVGGEAAVGPAVRAQLTTLGYTLNELSGANRYDTAAEVAEFAAANLGSIGQFNGLRTAIVATGTNFADALTAGAPAFAGKHPILLTRPDALPASVADALTTIAAQQVIVLGGTTAVSADVEAALVANGQSVVRIAGANRYATAKAVADTLIVPDPTWFDFYGTPPQEVVLVSGQNFADALSAGPHAGTIKAPMLLVQQCNIPAPTADFHVENNDVIDLVRAIGGTAAICDQVLTDAVAAATIATPTAELTAEEGRSFFTVEFDEAMDATTAQPADFAVAASPAVGIASVATLPTPGLAQAASFQVNLTAPLSTGDIVSLIAGTISTPAPDPRVNAAASANVGADTVRPTASLVPDVAGGVFYAIFSEPMGASALLQASYSASATGAGTFVDANNTTVRVPAVGLAVGGTIGVVGALPATGALDLAGNPVVAKSQPVNADTVNPFMQSATVTNLATAQAFHQSNTFNFDAVKGSAADGAAGNAYTFNFVNVDGASATISGPTSTGVITFRGDFDNGGSPALSSLVVANVWEANSTLSSLFDIGIRRPSMNGFTTPAALVTQGESTSSIAVQFSEAVEVGVNSIEIFSSNSAGATQISTGPAALTTAIDGKVTLTTMNITNPTLLPVPGTAAASTPAGGISDFTGNANTARTVTITAAS